MKSELHPSIALVKNNLFDLVNSAISVKFIWNPSHIEIFGNEKADELAKHAVDKDNIDIQEIFYREKYIFSCEENKFMNIYLKEYGGNNRKGLKYMY